MMHFTVAGSCNLDLVAYVDHLPQPGEAVHAREVRRVLGGKGFNQAVALRRLGVEVEFVGAVGRDPVGDEYVAAMDELGICRRGLRRSDDPTGLAVPVVDRTGENTIVVAMGANWSLRPEDLDESTLVSGSALLLQGELSPETTIAAARLARGAGVWVVLNAAPAAPALGPAVALAAAVVVNEGECQAFGGAGRLRTMTTGLLVVTLGAAGAHVHNAPEPLHVPAPAVKAVDTTGAGDAFVAALALALVEGRAPADAVGWAAAAGSAACTRSGTSSAMPTRDEVDSLYRTAAG